MDVRRPALLRTTTSHTNHQSRHHTTSSRANATSPLATAARQLASRPATARPSSTQELVARFGCGPGLRPQPRGATTRPSAPAPYRRTR